MKKIAEIDWSEFDIYRVLRVKDITKLLDVSERKAQELLRSPDLPSYKVGGHWFVEKNDFRLFLERYCESRLREIEARPAEKPSAEDLAAIEAAANEEAVPLQDVKESLTD